MEELVSLQYGSFTILGDQAREYAQKTSCSNRVADWTIQSQLYLSDLRRENPGWNTAQHQEWGLFLLEHLLHDAASMKRKEYQRCSQALQAEMLKWHPSVRTLLGFTDAEILKVTKQVYQEGYVMAPSVLPCWWQEECIKELHLELAWCMARAGLQSAPEPAMPTLWSRGCSHSWAQYPSAELHGAEAAKCPREDPLTGWSGSRRQHSHSRSRNQL